MNSSVAASTNPSSHRIVRFKEAMRMTGLARSTLYAYIAASLIKPTIKLGPRAVGFLESDLAEFIAARVEASRGAA